VPLLSGDGRAEQPFFFGRRAGRPFDGGFLGPRLLPFDFYSIRLSVI